MARQELLQLFITGIDNATQVVRVTEDCGVRELYDHVTKKASVSAAGLHSLRLLYAGRELDLNGEETLEDYDVSNMATLQFIPRILGGADSRIKWMSTQPLKTIGTVPGCPSVRGCPNCGFLLEHTERCKHMQCCKCGCQFCFVCLKVMVNGEWQCGSYSAVCPVAPVQTSLPNPIT